MYNQKSTNKVVLKVDCNANHVDNVSDDEKPVSKKQKLFVDDLIFAEVISRQNADSSEAVARFNADSAEAAARLAADNALGDRIDLVHGLDSVPLTGTVYPSLRHTVFRQSSPGGVSTIQLPLIGGPVAYLDPPPGYGPDAFVIYKIVNLSSFDVDVTVNASDLDLWDFGSYSNLGVKTQRCPWDWREFHVILMGNTWFIKAPVVANMRGIEIGGGDSLVFTRYTLPMYLRHSSGVADASIALPGLTSREAGRVVHIMKRAGGILTVKGSLVLASGGGVSSFNIPGASHTSYMCVWNGGGWVCSDNSV